MFLTRGDNHRWRPTLNASSKMRSSLVQMRYSLERMRSSLARMRSSLVQMRSSLVTYEIYTVRKMDLILRSIERMLQTQLSMARRFKLPVLRRYNVKFSKMRYFTLETLRLDKLKRTGGRRTNIPWIYSPRLYHCATGTHIMEAEF